MRIKEYFPVLTRVWLPGFFMLLCAIPFLFSYRHIGFSIESLWIIILPWCLFITDRGVRSFRFAAIALLSLGFHFWFQSSFGLYMAVFSIFLLLIELQVGRLNRWAPFILLLSTSIAAYVFDVFGFPIRIMLSHLATEFLSMFDSNTFTEGNWIHTSEGRFSVDEACAGLKMAGSTFAIMLLFNALNERKSGKSFGLVGFLLINLFAIFCIVLANWLRVILLVYFGIQPENWLHEAIGMAAFLICTLWSLWAFIDFLFKTRLAQIPIPKKTTVRLFPVGVVWGCIGLMSLYTAGFRFAERLNPQFAIDQIQIPGFHKTEIEGGILQFEKPGCLLYIKPNKGEFRLDHNPMLCWKGSGFQLVQVDKAKIANTIVYSGILTKENEKYYTTWWFDNGADRSISQFHWRYEMLKWSTDYKLVNVCAIHKEETDALTRMLLLESPFR